MRDITRSSVGVDVVDHHLAIPYEQYPDLQPTNSSSAQTVERLSVAMLTDT